MSPTMRRLVLAVGSAATIVLCGSLLLAQAAGPGYALRKDYAMEWAGRISLFGIVAAAALIGYVLLFRRRRTWSRRSRRRRSPHARVLRPPPWSIREDGGPAPPGG